MKDSRIEWTHSTFNAWSGCSRVSPACAHCYAEALARRAPGTFGGWGRGAARRRTRPENWDMVPRWNRQAAANGRQHLVFVNSLSDWLDDEVPAAWQNDLLRLIEDCPHLTFQLLSKRLENWQGVMVNALNEGIHIAHEWVNSRPPANVWLGTTVEDQRRADKRIPELREIPARIRFLSCEPLLEAVDLRFTTGMVHGEDIDDYRVDWVICGGESGPGSRPMHPDWARSLRDQCADAAVPFFFKQWGGARKKEAGRLLDGMEYNAFPALEEAAA